MQRADIRCHTCGGLPIGTLEYAVARFHQGEAWDEVAWAGEIDTEDTHTVCLGGFPILVCENGHHYHSGLFTKTVLATLD